MVVRFVVCWSVDWCSRVRLCVFAFVCLLVGWLFACLIVVRFVLRCGCSAGWLVDCVFA